MNASNWENTEWSDKLRPANFIKYLLSLGWTQTRTNSKWRVFTIESIRDTENMPAEIVIPADLQVNGIGKFLLNSVHAISTLYDISVNKVLDAIYYFDIDVLQVRSTETGDFDSIPLAVAQNQISNIRALVRFAVGSERQPRPYFENQIHVAESIENHFRFGHTFKGSFGMTVESPIINPVDELIDEQTRQGQLSLLDSSDFPDGWKITDPPPERKIIERIARGLAYTSQAVMERDISPLVEGYASGFNGNMCNAIADLLSKSTSPIEIGVLWSPIIQPSEDIIQFSSITLTETSLEYLHTAGNVLREREPQYETIHGRVTELSSQGSPSSDNAEITRSVVIQWTERPRGLPSIRVIVQLGRDDYLKAIKAHSDWSTVEVTGILSRTGRTYRLLAPQNFVVLNPLS